MQGKRKTHEEYVAEILSLVGTDYKVVEEYINTHTKIKMFHTKCGNEFYIEPNSFLSGRRCPYCCPTPKQVAIGTNSMYDTNKKLTKLLLNPNDGYKYTQYSNKEVDWKCPYCGEIIRHKKISYVNRNGLSCPICGNGSSYPNRLMFSFLKYLHIDFEIEKSFKWCKYKLNNKIRQGKYDFYFNYNNQEYVIEMDGEWHFKDNTLSGQTKEESNFIDAEKDRLAREHGIHPIRINSRESKLEFITKEIIQSDLSDIFDLSQIDWQECECQSVTSLKIQACDLWEKHHNTKIISEIMKYNQATIIKWLKSCTEIGLCNYVSMSKHKVFCEEYKEYFDSITEAENKFKIRGIYGCLVGKQKYAGKLPDGTQLHWRYATEEEIQSHNIKTA